MTIPFDCLIIELNFGQVTIDENGFDFTYARSFLFLINVSFNVPFNRAIGLKFRGSQRQRHFEFGTNIA